MTPEAAIVELGPVDLMKLAEGGEVRIGVVSIRAGEHSTCSIIGQQQSPRVVPELANEERALQREREGHRRPLPGEGPNVGTRKVITTLRFVRFPKPCALCSNTVHSGERAKWCPQTKDIFHEKHEDDECLAVVLV